ncbi:MAG: hypothetical protein LBE56_07530 [Tannerella sp.]|jgi:hypothetical protein|nr:hypothetical protein [Tannerella sp.]
MKKFYFLLCCGLLFAAMGVKAQSFDLATQDANIVATATPSTYTITQSSGASTQHFISVTGSGTVNIILNGTLNPINVVAIARAFYIASGVTVNLTLIGTSTFTSGNYYAGINVPTGASLIIDGAGTLNVNGGGTGGVTNTGGGAGIGGNGDGSSTGAESNGTIIINGGVFDIKGGDATGNSVGGGAGIGGGGGGNNAAGNGSQIYINGGKGVITGGSASSGGLGNTNKGGGAGIGGGGAGSPGQGGTGNDIHVNVGTFNISGGTSDGGNGADVGGGGSGGAIPEAGDDDDNYDPSITVSSISVSPDNLSFNVGEQLNLSSLIITRHFSDGTTTDQIYYVDFYNYNVTSSLTEGKILSLSDNGITFTIECSGQTANVDLIVTASYKATININLDGLAWMGNDKELNLYQSGSLKYEFNTVGTRGLSGEIIFIDVESDIYDIFDGTTDTGINIDLSAGDNSVSLDYYTIKFSGISPDGSITITPSTVTATYDGSSAVDGEVVLGGKTLIITVNVSGASLYNYDWSTSSTGGNPTPAIVPATMPTSATTSTMTITGLTDAVTAICSITGRFDVVITTNLDGTATSLISTVLELHGTPNYTVFTDDGNGKHTFTNVAVGTYAIYDDNGDTGETVVLPAGGLTAILDYYTISIAIVDDPLGLSSSSTFTATYNKPSPAFSVTSGDIVLGGGDLVIEAFGNGPAGLSYSYSWWEDPLTKAAPTYIGETYTSDNHGTTIPLLQAKVNITCSVLGTVIPLPLKSQSITLPAPNITKYLGDAPFNPGAKASSGLSVKYVSSDPSIASVDASGNIVIHKAGTVIITVSQSGNSSFSAAIDVSFMLTILPPEQQKPSTPTAQREIHIPMPPDGVILDIQHGVHYVEIYHDFKFKLTFTNGEVYRVRTNRIDPKTGKQEELIGVPNGKGEYEYSIINVITQPIYVYIGPDTRGPVGNEVVNNHSIYVQNRTLYMNGLVIGESWGVYNITGALVTQGVANGNSMSVLLPGRGIFIVRLGNKSMKVVN